MFRGRLLNLAKRDRAGSRRRLGATRRSALERPMAATTATVVEEVPREHGNGHHSCRPRGRGPDRRCWLRPGSPCASVD